MQQFNVIEEPRVPVKFNGKRLPNHPNGQTSLCMVEHDNRIPGVPPSNWTALSQAEQDAWKLLHLTPEEWHQAQANLRDAMMALHLNYPFFGIVLTRVAEKTVWVRTEAQWDRIGRDWRTMATDGRWLYVWPQFALYNTVFELVGILLHEVMHVIFLHNQRTSNLHPKLANYAKDYAINLVINDLARTMHKHDPRTFEISLANLEKLPFCIPPWPISIDPTNPRATTLGVDASGWLVDDKYRTDDYQPLMWETIYRLLDKEFEGEARKALEEGGDTLGGRRLVDSHRIWDPRRRPDAEDGTRNDDPFDLKRAKNAVLDAKARTNKLHYGMMPGAMKRQVEEMINPPLPWNRLLQRYMKLAVGDASYVPGDWRFNEPMPAFSEKEELTWAIFTFDVSGSMSDREIAEAIGNAKAVLASYPNMRGMALFWDARVSDAIPLEKFTGTIEREGFSGGGGTDIAPQFEKIRELGLEQETSVVVCFTDGLVPWQNVDPNALPYDVLWVITNQEQNAPEHPRYRQTRLEVGRK